MVKADILKSSFVVKTILCALACTYLYICLNYTSNNPYSTDDIYVFLHQFDNKFLAEKNSILDRFIYFFKVAVHPHPKITSKLILVSSYYLLGEVNFKFIQILGSTFFLVFVYLLKNYSKSKIAYLTVVSLILVPLYLNFWTIFISGFPFIMAAVLMSFNFLVKKNLYYFSLLIIVVPFMQGSGFLCPLICICYILIQYFYNRDKRFLVFSVPTILSLILFFVTISSTKSSSGSSIEFVNLLDKFIYFLNFLAFGISKYFSKASYFFYGWIFGSLMFVFSLYKSFQLFKNKLYNNREKTLVLFLGFLTSVILLATMIRSKHSDILFASIIPRYELYSIMYISTFYLLLVNEIQVLKRFKEIFLLIVFAFSIFLYQCRIKSNLNQMKIISARKTEKTFHKMSYANKSYTKKGESAYLNSAFQKGLYNPNFHQFLSSAKVKTLKKLPSDSVKKEYHAEHYSFVNIHQIQLCISRTSGMRPILLLKNDFDEFEIIEGENVNDKAIKRKCTFDGKIISLNFWIDANRYKSSKLFLALMSGKKVKIVDEIDFNILE